MTLPEGRTPMSWDDVWGVEHYDSKGRRRLPPQSTWEGEAKQLRAENERLRRAMQAAITFCEAGSAPTAALVLSDALRAPYSGKSGKSKLD